MIHQGICPKCGKRVLHVHVEAVNGMVANESKAACLSYSCIHCFAVLGVQNSVSSRVSYGGTAPVNVKAQAERWLAALE